MVKSKKGAVVHWLIIILAAGFGLFLFSRFDIDVKVKGDWQSDFLSNYYLEGANFGALRNAEKQWDSTIDDYFKRIKNGYKPTKIWEY